MRRANRGFTLLELLVAVAILGVMSVMAYDGLRNFLAGRARLETRVDAFAQVVRTVGQLQQDFEHLMARPVRDALGDREPACRTFREENVYGVALTRYTPWPSLAGGAADLRRVEYRLREGRLWRREWAALDRTSATPFRERALPLAVSALTLRFFGPRGWQDDWPAAGQGEDDDAVPRAVGVTLTLPDGRVLNRLFRVGGLRP